jgi:hypothetical protein
VQRLLGKGVTVYYLEEDAKRRGLERPELIEGAKPIAAHALPELFESYEQVWRW